MGTSEDLKLAETELEKRRQTAVKLDETVHSFVEKRSSRNSTYMFVLEGTVRRNLFSLLALYYLSSHPELGSQSLDISRQMIEDMISIEWMEINNPEKQATKFDRFTSIQKKQNLDQMIRIGLTPTDYVDQAAIDDIDKKYESIKAEFTDNRGNVFHNYNHQSVETMIEAIRGKVSNMVFTEDDLNAILHWYLEGNGKNHFNPDDVVWFFNDDLLPLHQTSACERAMFVGINSLVQMLLRYIDEIHKIDKTGEHKELREQIRSLVLN